MCSLISKKILLNFLQKYSTGPQKQTFGGVRPRPNHGICYSIILANILIWANAEKKCWTGFEQSMSMTTTLEHRFMFTANGFYLHGRPN